MLTVSQPISPLKKGDKIISVNRYKIADIIDFRFHMEVQNYLNIDRRGRLKEINVDANDLRKLSFVKDIPVVKKCVNRCKFCFIDQLPPGLRKSLYFKDDDWRLSFLTGNFVTLTNINDKQIERIARQRISPLYISLHATTPAKRQLMGLKDKKNVISKLNALDMAGIITHIQVVLCPGINDGIVLENTLAELQKFKNIKSVGLVPVGLTKYHRNGLKSFTPEKAKKLIDQIEPLQLKYRKEKKLNWVYLADEFYLSGGNDVPQNDYYDDFDQLENGIGLVRNWLDDFEGQKLEMRNEKLEIEDITMLTSELFGPVLKKTFSDLKYKINVQVIKNNFFGPKITVAGLITAQDIIEQIKPTQGPIFIPDVMVNEDKLFLDGLSFDQLKKRLPTAYLVLSRAKDFINWFRNAGTVL